MSKGRLEAFSDGVLAIIITIMVLELRVPHGAELADLRPLLPALLSYVLSFIYLGIYWNNHHHLMHASERVDGRVLWANLLLLFWLSLVPFATAWMGENHFAPRPVALYGVPLLMAALSYTLLVRALLARHGPGSVLAAAIGSDLKGNVSIACYVIGIALAVLVSRWLGLALYAIVALIWLVPDLRIERALARHGHGE
jgi:TMEM175 potassium channel family protein